MGPQHERRDARVGVGEDVPERVLCAVERLARRLQRGVEGRVAGRHVAPQHGQEGLVQAVLGEVAVGLGDEGVVGALPVLVDDVVAEQARQHAERLDRAVAAEGLDGRQHHPVGVLTRAHLGEVRPDAQPGALGLGELATLLSVEVVREAHRSGQDRLTGGAHAGDHLLDQREAGDGLPEGDPALGVGLGDEARSAGDADGPDGVVEARGVDDLRHQRPKALVDRADGVPDRAVEVDLRRRHRARPDLVLEAPHGEVVDDAVLEEPRDEEQAEPAGAVPGDARGHQDEVRVGVRAEPLLAGDAPAGRPEGLPVGGRGDRVEADVRSALDLGDELRAVEPLGVAGGQDAGEPARLERGAALRGERLGDPGGAGHGAVVAGLARVAREVEERQRARVRRRIGVGRDDLAVLVDVAAAVVVARVVCHRLGALAERGPAVELRLVAGAVVDDRGGVQRAGADRAEGREVRLVGGEARLAQGCAQEPGELSIAREEVVRLALPPRVKICSCFRGVRDHGRLRAGAD